MDGSIGTSIGSPTGALCEYIVFSIQKIREPFRRLCFAYLAIKLFQCNTNKQLQKIAKMTLKHEIQIQIAGEKEREREREKHSKQIKKASHTNTFHPSTVPLEIIMHLRVPRAKKMEITTN